MAEQQVIVDAVCSAASEEIQMDAWGIDVVMTASQKGLGTPPGLSILVASQRAIQVCPFLHHTCNTTTYANPQGV